MFSNSRIFFILCLSFIAGVLIAPILPKIIMAIAAMIFVCTISIWWEAKWARLVGFAGLVLLLGALRFQVSVGKNNLSQFYGKQVVGVVVEEPDVRADKTYLTVGKLEINGQRINDQLLVSMYPSRNFNYGDKLNLSGKVQEPFVFPDFNYKNYLSRFGVHAVVYYPTYEITLSNQANPIKSGLLNIKTRFLSNLTRVLPEPQNAFLAGLLVGSKRAIPQNLTDAFNTTGTSHMVAISGFNVTIIVFALDLLLARFGKRVSFGVNILVIIAFIILTGATASVIRAGIMAGLVLVAKNIGRLYHPQNALALTAAVMVAVNPQILLFDVGFQLSFLALVGLVSLSPILNQYLNLIPGILREFLVATIAAQIFALPILLYNFDTLSLIAPVTNVLVLPLVPAAMLFGFATGLAGFLWKALAAALAWPAYLVLSYIIVVVEWTAKLPYASLSAHINLYGLVIYYAVLVGSLWIYHHRRRNQKILAVAEKFTLYKV
jgi:competence protein ComEC